MQRGTAKARDGNEKRRRKKLPLPALSRVWRVRTYTCAHRGMMLRRAYRPRASLPGRAAMRVAESSFIWFRRADRTIRADYVSQSTATSFAAVSPISRASASTASAAVLAPVFFKPHFPRLSLSLLLFSYLSLSLSARYIKTNWKGVDGDNSKPRRVSKESISLES